MSSDEQEVVSLQDVLEEDQQLQVTANAVLGDSDDSQCTYSKGYVYRQALYACSTCASKDGEPAGVCLACSLHCHDNHELFELYTKRNFRCDCGNSKFPGFKCTLYPDKEPLNGQNQYNHNFSGAYCTCARPYPDSEDEVEDEMIQCFLCEDWFHSRHLKGKTPSSYSEMACDACMKSHDFLRMYQQRVQPVRVVKGEGRGGEDITIESPSPEKASPEKASTSAVSSCKEGGCELERRRGRLVMMGGCEDGAGYFDDNWREQLCRCSKCMELYSLQGCCFLLEPGDTVAAYEERSAARPSTHDAGLAALATSLDRVQQVEMLHQYSEMKSELSDFLATFAREGKVVGKRDIEGFFEELQVRKRRRVELGEGLPPANCHF